MRTLQDILDRASAQMAFTMVLLVIAAGVALMLGVIGIYGVMSYIVSQRTGEIGVRLALGAEPGSVAAMIVRQGGVVAVAGITVGSRDGVRRQPAHRVAALRCQPARSGRLRRDQLLLLASRSSPAGCPRAAPRDSARSRRCARSR